MKQWLLFLWVGLVFLPLQTLSPQAQGFDLNVTMDNLSLLEVSTVPQNETIPIYDSIELPEAPGLAELENDLPKGADWFLEERELSASDWKSLLTLSPGDFFSAIGHLLTQQVKRPLGVLGGLLGVLLLCAMLEGLGDTASDGALKGVFTAVSVGSAAAALAAPMVEAISDTIAVIEECGLFISSFIPVFASVVTAGGKATSAGVYSSLVFIACQVFSRIASVLLVPLMGVFMAFCLEGSIAPGIQIQPLANTVRQVVNWTLGLLLTLFVTLLSIQTLVASSGDQVLAKTAKFLVGSFVPVVGGALADAYTATQGYMQLIKSTVGVFGILIALLTFLPVVLQTVLWYLMANVVAAAGEVLGVKQMSGLLKSAASALGVLMAVTLCFGLMFILSTSMVLIMTI